MSLDLWGELPSVQVDINSDYPLTILKQQARLLTEKTFNNA